MSKPNILIIGCGAVGLTQGYHLSAGANITFLVRPGRKPAFTPPKKLYDYKENALRIFDSYRLVESASEIAEENFYCVFDTLDGHTARSEAGTATIRAVGDLIRHKPETFVVYDAIGLEMEDHYALSLGITKDRLFMAASMLAHQPTDSISVPASADGSVVAQADVLYSWQPDHVGLLAFNTRPKLLKSFQEVYNKNSKLRVQVAPAFVEPWAILLGTLHQVVWKIDAFDEFEHLRRNRALWPLLIAAQKEILRSPRLGWSSWLLSWVLGSWLTAKMFHTLIEGALPLCYREFNAFQHGHKVVEQDLQTLKDVMVKSEKDGRAMEALSEICRMADDTGKVQSTRA